MKIPARVRIKHNCVYEVVTIKSFADGETMGECRYDDKQIVILEGMTDTQTAKTFLHEVLHAIQYEYQAGITESQVRKLEDGIWRVLRLNKWI